MKYQYAGKLLLFIVGLWLSGCSDEPFNNPYPKAQAKANTFYSSFTQQPKTLDPAKSYSSNEYIFIAQIYEPPLQYHYLKRPYTLIPLAAIALPIVSYFSKDNKPLPADAPSQAIAYSLYTIQIKPGRYFQPHPAFAKDQNGNYIYHAINEDYLNTHNIYRLRDFKINATRELTAGDYIYQIKRLAHPQIHSPIFGLMSEHIVGLAQYAKKLQVASQKLKKSAGHDEVFLDLRNFSLPSVKKIDRYTFQIKIKGKYPQFNFWLALPFFAPMPWEADLFYSQPGMDDHNITLDWYPVGTGPYMLLENNPNSEMVMIKNPNFSGESYPTEGMPGDKERGLLTDAGKALPFIDKVIFHLEKEAIPRWNKFLQGYYDNSGIASDSFDQAITIDDKGKPHLTKLMQNLNVRLQTSVGASVFYLGFNMLDDVVGGTSERARKLRRAIAIAVDYQEFISIFLNGRGIPAQGPIPPGIFGYLNSKEGIDPFVYRWHKGKVVRRSIQDAKLLLAQAGYPNGRDAITAKPIWHIFHYLK